MVLFPNGKINIGLQVLRKRSDGYHDLDTLFYPVPICDALEVVPGNGTLDADFSTSGIPIDGDKNDNLCLLAYYLLKQGYPQIPKVALHLHKIIPMGAGLGGGSSDGAHALLLLNKFCILGLSNQDLYRYALQLGSDCPFFVYNKPAFAGGRGEQLTPSPLDLAGHRMVLVFPSIHINTAWAFQQIKPKVDRPKLQHLAMLPISEWKDVVTNDFESPAFQQHPELAHIKKQLYASGAIYASMTGSGSTIFGLFRQEENPNLDFPPHYFVRHFILPAQAGLPGAADP